MSHSHLTIGLSIALATVVFLSSVHALQVLNSAATLPSDDARKAIGHDTPLNAKTVTELHHHTDKSGSQLINDINDHQLYADHRSLRLLHKKESWHQRLAARWLRVLKNVHMSHNA